MAGVCASTPPTMNASSLPVTAPLLSGSAGNSLNATSFIKVPRLLRLGRLMRKVKALGAATCECSLWLSF